MSNRTPLFDQIDTFIIRVADYKAAAAWYAVTLGLEATFIDPDECLAVLPLAHGSSLTLWQCTQGDSSTDPTPAGAFPIFATSDAAWAMEELKSRGVTVGDLIDRPGVRYFQFFDLDGNHLEACQVFDV